MEKNYDYYHAIFDKERFKYNDYLPEINYALKTGGKKYGKWGLCSSNNKEGTLDENGNWSFINTLNTHRKCFQYICELYEKFNGTELDFSTRDKRIESCQLIGKFLLEKYELFFTTNITFEYYTQFELYCNKSWMGGVIDNIAFTYFAQRFFPEIKIKEIIWDDKRGNADDFIGIDIRILFVTGYRLTVQLKRGRQVKVDDTHYYLEGAANGFDKPVDFYGYVDINPSMNYVEIFLFPHNKSYDQPPYVVVPKKDIKVIKEFNMTVPETLLSMLTFCAENKIVFNLTKEGEKNDVTFSIEPKKEVNVVISDFDDEKLGEYLVNKFEELQKFFK